MKIVTIGPTYPYRGGISHYNTLLSKSLSKKHKVISISFKRLYPKFLFPGKDQKDKKSSKKIGFDTKEILDSINPFSWFNCFLKIKREKPDLIIMYWWTPFFSPMYFILGNLIKRFTSSKILFLCHNVLPHEKRFIDKLLTRSVLRYSDFFIVHSKQDKDDLIGMIKDAKVRVTVHPTYDVFKESFIKKDISYLKLKKKVILFFGFIRPYKGLNYLIDAIPEILKSIDLDLLIVGEVWGDKKFYLDKIESLGIKNNVKFIDSYVPNEDVGNYFEVADVIVLPYLTATNSGIVQTAFGFNKPVIVSDVGGLPEVVSDNKTGFVVKPKDSKQIAEAVIKFYKKKKKDIFIKNIKKEKERFSWDRVVELIDSFR